MRLALAATLTALIAPTALAQTAPDLRQRMPYGEARRAVLAAGWQANTNNIARLNELDAALQSWFIKQNYTEIRFCRATGIGTCTAVFHDAKGKQLFVYTSEAGDNEPWIVSWCIGRDDINCAPNRRR